jgi:hypothetical protein
MNRAEGHQQINTDKLKTIVYCLSECNDCKEAPQLKSIDFLIAKKIASNYEIIGNPRPGGMDNQAWAIVLKTLRLEK